MRASHEDRDRVVDALRVAGGDGRLSAEELDTRLERALSARTLGELAGLTADLPNAPAAKEVPVIRQHAGKYVQQGRWLVPARIELRTQMCRVTLDFTHAVITSSVLRIDADMQHGKLFIVRCPEHRDQHRRAHPHLLQAQAPLHERRCRSPSPHRARRQSSCTQRSSRSGLNKEEKRLIDDRDGPDHPRPRRHPVLAAPRTSPEDCGPQSSHQPVSPELTGDAKHRGRRAISEGR